MSYKDILYDDKDGIARITINRPAYNALTADTVEELIRAFNQAGWDKSVRVIVFGGAGDKAFCTGGDQKAHQSSGSFYGGRGVIGIPIDELIGIMRAVPKPVIARVQGYAIGAGNILATVCDLTIASDKAQFGQVGPRVGSVDTGWGSAYLARLIGEKRAREFWFLCKRYTASQALEMGLINAVAPFDELDAEVNRWCEQIKGMSPTALAISKRGFNAASAHIGGINDLGMYLTRMFYDTEESQEGVKAFNEKRKPEFDKYAR
jgi:2-ketocyclohexanecarboxyl-CoA hydrolase